MIVSVINQKGGVGKTTTAVNLAVAMAQMQRKVLLVDLDPQGNASSGLGFNGIVSPTLYEALTADTADRNGNPDFPDTGRPLTKAGPVEGLSVLGSTTDLAGAEVELASNAARDDLKRVLDCLGSDHPLIVIDTPPSLSILTVNALVAADQLIIPVQCEYYALEGLGQLLRTLERIRGGLNPSLRILGLLRTMYDGRLGLSSQVSAELERHFPKLLFRTIIPRNVRLAEAPSHGKPVALYDPRSPGARSYKELAGEALHRLETPV